MNETRSGAPALEPAPAPTAEPAPALEPAPTFEGRLLPDPSEPAWDQGLAFDVETLIGRRRVLQGLGLGLLGVGLAACGASGSTAAAPASATSAAATATSGTASRPASAAVASECAVIPEETGGPFPGDGSNGPDVLAQSGVVRQDIRSSFGTSSTTATGVPLTIRFAVLDLARACAPYARAAIYVWHCDQAGRYSLYSQGVEAENYLRGVQAAGDDGIVEFTSVFPACYQGRWPHIHFEVYPSLDKATAQANRIATSQIALPSDTCQTVYASTGYESSIATFSQVSLATDMVFADDQAAHQLGTVSGSIADGLTVELAVAVRG
jgi:protocatechuate 3,4-dioxygenase beta subunit